MIESDGIFKVTKVYESKFTIKIEKLKYEGLLAQNGHIKFEIDRHQNVVFRWKKNSYKNVGMCLSPDCDG